MERAGTWDEGPLVKRAQRGDRRAFAAIYEAYADRLFRAVLLPRLGDRQAAEDALAETFRIALERLPSFDDRGVSVYFWLSRIAMNQATDQHRRAARTGRALIRFEHLLGPLRPSAPRPEAALLEAQRSAAVTEAIGEVMTRLHPRYRRALTLRFFDERSRQECAEALEVKLGTFDVVLLRALRAFRREWDRHVGPVEEEVGA
jgi:RNA polymerase sigma factor (sigma-70 family)